MPFYNKNTVVFCYEHTGTLLLLFLAIIFTTILEEDIKNNVISSNWSILTELCYIFHTFCHTTYSHIH